MTTTDNLRRTRDIHAAFSQGDLDTALAMAHDDIEVLFQPAKQVFRGREAFLQFMQAFTSAFPDIVLEHTSELAQDDRVAVEFRWTGTHSGPLATPQGPLAPTGRRIEDGRVCEVMEWRDGKLARIVNYQDWGSVVAQLTA